MVGDVKTIQFNSKKGKLAKSVYDAGWFELKRQLDYKCKRAGLVIENERVLSVARGMIEMLMPEHLQLA